MTQRGSGYNNPAFCNQFDNSLYDYEYVPEIDPDSPDLQRKSSYRIPKQVPPWQLELQQQILDNRNSSDESNGSIIVEERNNRRITLICEKRPSQLMDKDGGYVHNISLESSDGNSEEVERISKRDYNSQHSNLNNQHKRYRREENQVASKPKNYRVVNPIRHRYEDLEPARNVYSTDSRHRYAEIDEELETEGVHFTHRKPRAPSPEEYLPNSYPFSIDDSPIFQNSYSNFRHTSSPINHDDAFEMSDFSPPLNNLENQRHPPIGASANHAPTESSHQKNYSKNVYKASEKMCRSSPVRHDDKKFLTPKNSVKDIKFISKSHGAEKPKQSARRNISSSFIEQRGSPYKTTTEAINRNTAVITPILQRKFADYTSEKSNFQKISRMFQSTGNVLKDSHDGRTGYQVHPINNLNRMPDHGRGDLKRNKSVPNFQASNDRRTPKKVRPELVQNIENPFGKLEYSSPTKSPEKFSPLHRSRLSLITSMKSSSELEERVGSTSGCLMLTAVVQLLAGIITCGICFYLLSRLGRRYYLELGTLGGFVSMILGGLGFRSHSWKWLPNRNYVSGYVILSGFSLLNAAAVFLIVTVRPMARDPLLDVCAGAISTLSVIIIALALTGLTMSGCCKTPPPDNRVTSA